MSHGANWMDDWRWPRPTARTLLWLVPLAVALGLWQGATVLLAMRNDGDTTRWTEPFTWELTGALAGMLCSYIPITATLNAPSPRTPWFFGVHGLAYVVFTVTKSAIMLGSRHVVYPLLGWGRYQYSYWAGHLAMEAMKDLIVYAVVLTAFSLYLSSRQRQEHALRAAELATELKESRLEALLAQLNPHFLMNALNTVSSVMYEDVARTDRLLSDLGLILRASFESDRPTWTLAEERAHTERFVSLLLARFSDRLRVEWDIPDEVERAAVPRFAFQLLVENAVKHNQDQRQLLTLRIRARARAERLELEVEDTGRGFGSPSPARGAGLGLHHLEEVLRLLHGGAAEVRREAGPEGGARVRLCFPTA
jgi:two-component system LytT family sensor kinase